MHFFHLDIWKQKLVVIGLRARFKFSSTGARNNKLIIKNRAEKLKSLAHAFKERDPPRLFLTSQTNG